MVQTVNVARYNFCYFDTERVNIADSKTEPSVCFKWLRCIFGVVVVVLGNVSIGRGMKIARSLF